MVWAEFFERFQIIKFEKQDGVGVQKVEISIRIGNPSLSLSQ